MASGRKRCPNPILKKGQEGVGQAKGWGRDFQWIMPRAPGVLHLFRALSEWCRMSGGGDGVGLLEVGGWQGDESGLVVSGPITEDCSMNKVDVTQQCDKGRDTAGERHGPICPL